MTRLAIGLLLIALTVPGSALAQMPGPNPSPPDTPAQDADAPAPDADADAPTGPVVNPPAVLTPAEPIYPPEALAERVHGIVVVELSISDTGAVENVTVGSLTVVSESGEPRAGDGRYQFGPAALEAAKQMVFRPAEYDGKPFAVQINFTFRFVLPEKPKTTEPVTGPPAPVKKPEVNYRGALVERGSRSSVPGATITVFRGEGESLEGYEATSGADGRFVFYDLPSGTWQVRIEREGYIAVKTDELISTNEVVEGKYWIEKGSYSEYDITIEAERPRKEVNRRSLSTAEFSKVPGTISDDPVLVVENLPGVGRSSFGSGEIIVRGSGPQDTGVFVNGIAVPLIYHFGGLKSVVPASVVGGIDFYPGNYSVAYGRAMGGILDLKLKRLKPDIVHGSADVSVLDTSLYLEVPLGKNAAIAFAGRRSYIDFVLDAAIPEDADIALVSAPRYYDYQFLGNWRPKKAHDIRWLALGSDDLFELLFDDPADPTGVIESNEISAQTAFQRVIGEYKYTPNEKISNLVRMSVGNDQLNFSAFGAFAFDADLLLFQLRDNFVWNANKQLSLETGFDSTISRFSGVIKLPALQSEGENDPDGIPDEILTQEIMGDFDLDLAPFVEASIRLDKLTIVPGLRLDYFGQQNQVSIDPRVSARYELPDDVAVKGGVAVVHQAPLFPELDEVFGNPDLDLQRALQYSVGVEWKPFENIRGDFTLFYKDLDNLVSPTDAMVMRGGMTVPLRFDNEGTGRVYGAEAFVEHKFANNFRGWVSYTLSRAERIDSGETEARLFDFDQTHILAVVASYIFPRNWELGARFRLVSGSPNTPIIGGIFRSESDRYDPIYGETNSSRLPMFQQLDVRVDKTFVYDTWKFSAYLSLINATNHANVESLTHNFDYSEEGSVNGLPVIPVFGLKGNW